MKKISGVYKITNRVNGYFYYGSSKDLYRRWDEHQKLKNSGCIKLHNAMKKHGINNFEFEVVLQCPVNKLSHYEQKYLDKYCGLNECYNISKYADSPMRGRHMSIKTKKLMSKINSTRDRTAQWKSIRINNSMMSDKLPKKISHHTYGEMNSTVLNEKKVIKIRNLYSTGKFSMQNLADKFGCSKRMIVFVIHRKFWKHI